MNKLSFVLVYFLNPFFATIQALRTLNEKLIVFAITLFMGFFGTTTFFYGDNQRYRDVFFIMHQKALSLENFTNTFYDGETTFDIAIPLISYIVSIFTGNEKILFAIFGSIFGYFFSKNLVIAISVSKYIESKSKVILFFIILFCFIYPFWAGTNAPRFVIANTIFFYFLFQFIAERKKINLLFLSVSILFHFSFIIPTLITICYLFFYKKKKMVFLFAFFITSFILIEIIFDPLKNFLSSFTPDLFLIKTKSYTADNFIQGQAEIDASKSWHSLYYKKVFHFTIAILIVHLFYFRKKLSSSLLFNRFLSFTLFYFTFANILSAIPGLDRFLQLAYMLSIVCILIYISQYKIDKIFKIAIMPLLFWLIVIIRAGFDFITVGTIISNPVLAFFGFMDNVNLIQFIK